MTEETLSVLLADDHPIVLDGLRALLDATDGVGIAAEATNGHDAVRLARELQPDVVVMDLQMPGLGGIEATAQIARDSPHMGVLVLTMFEDDDSVFAAMRAGARGYLLKGADGAEIVHAIRAVARGEAIFGAPVARRIIEFFAAVDPAAHPLVFPELTAREREVLELVAQGRSNADITRLLVLSPKTVRNHVSNIFTKLQVTDRAQAIVRARDAGLGRG